MSQPGADVVHGMVVFQVLAVMATKYVMMGPQVLVVRVVEEPVVHHQDKPILQVTPMDVLIEML